jgi:hypothetical protein
MNEFKKADRVICINDQFQPDRQHPFLYSEISLPKKGRIYTVREVVQTPLHGEGLRLLELQSPTYRHDIGGVEEPCFSPSRFRIMPPVGEN